MFQRLRQMLIKEFIQVFRDPRMRVVIFVLPCIQMVVIGYAVNTDIRNVRTAVCDLDNSPPSRELTARFVHSGYFDVVERTDSPRRWQELIDRSQVNLVLVYQHGFAENFYGGRTAQVQLVLDGTDSNTAGVVLGYARTIVAGYSQQILVDRLQRTTGTQPPDSVALDYRAWFNENLESRNYFVPGVLSFCTNPAYQGCS